MLLSIYPWNEENANSAYLTKASSKTNGFYFDPSKYRQSFSVLSPQVPYTGTQWKVKGVSIQLYVFFSIYTAFTGSAEAIAKRAAEVAEQAAETNNLVNATSYAETERTEALAAYTAASQAYTEAPAGIQKTEALERREAAGAAANAARSNVEKLYSEQKIGRAHV